MGLNIPALTSDSCYKTQEESPYPEQLGSAVGPLIKVQWVN